MGPNFPWSFTAKAVSHSCSQRLEEDSVSAAHAKIYSEGHTKGKLSQFPRQLVASAYSPALCPQSLGAGNVQGQCEGNEEVDFSLGNSCQQYSEQVGMGNFFIVL